MAFLSLSARSSFHVATLLALADVTAMVRAEEIALPEPIRGKDYSLVFQDEFNGAKGALPDADKWNHLQKGKWRQLWNVEDACQQDGAGNLQIAIRRNGDRVETGYIATNRKFEATHGYFEVRCQLQKAAGTWSAFWIQTPTMGKPLNDPSEAGVEIDVMEYVGGEASNYYRDKINHTAHWNGYKDPEHQGFHIDKKIPGVSEGFHTFAVKWDEEGYIFYTDNVESGRWPKTVPISNRPQYLILSCEAEGWAGDLSKATLPDAFVIDYIRAYQTPSQIAADQKRKEKAPEAK